MERRTVILSTDQPPPSLTGSTLQRISPLPSSGASTGIYIFMLSRMTSTSPVHLLAHLRIDLPGRLREWRTSGSSDPSRNAYPAPPGEWSLARG